jgi:hypothetical protein
MMTVLHRQISERAREISTTSGHALHLDFRALIGRVVILGRCLPCTIDLESLLKRTPFRTIRGKEVLKIISFRTDYTPRATIRNQWTRELTIIRQSLEEASQTIWIPIVKVLRLMTWCSDGPRRDQSSPCGIQKKTAPSLTGGLGETRRRASAIPCVDLNPKITLLVTTWRRFHSQMTGDQARVEFGTSQWPTLTLF